MDFENIDRYLANKMTTVEKEEFERDMERDAQLKQIVGDLQRGIDELKIQERSDLKSRLRKLEKQLGKEDRSEKQKYYVWLLLGLSIIVLVFIWIFWPGKKIEPVPPPVERVQLDSASASEPDIIPPDTPRIQNQQPVDQIKIKETKEEPNGQELFAAHFEPYTNEELENEVRSGGEKSPYEEFKHYYINERYKNMLQIYDSLDSIYKDMDEVQLMKAIACIKENDTQAAMIILDSLSHHDGSALAKDINWYLALCHLKMNEFQKTKIILQRPLFSGDKKAKQLLAQL